MLHRYNNPYVEEKVYLERILRADEVEAFSQTLRPHQLAIGGDGLTVLKRAVRSRRLHRLMTLCLLFAGRVSRGAVTADCGGLSRRRPDRRLDSSRDRDD